MVQRVQLPTNNFFIGEIINIYIEERFLSEGKPDVKKIEPFLLTMPDNKFWSIGKQIGKAWSDGITFRDRLKKE